MTNNIVRKVDIYMNTHTHTHTHVHLQCPGLRCGNKQQTSRGSGSQCLGTCTYEWVGGWVCVYICDGGEERIGRRRRNGEWWTYMFVLPGASGASGVGPV